LFIDPILCFPRETNYSRSLNSPILRPSLSPEELELRQNKVLIPKVAVEPAEVWSIGIILLSVCLLSGEESFYTAEYDYKVQHERIQTGLQKISQRYSVNLHHTIKGCLSMEPNLRPSILNLWEEVENRRAEDTNSVND